MTATQAGPGPRPAGNPRTGRLRRRHVLGALVALAVMLVAATSCRLPPGEITTVGLSFHIPDAIVTGPDGNLWITNRGNQTITRMTTAGATDSFTDPSISGPADIAVGPDGALWFTNQGNASIGRITTDGHISSFTGTGISSPFGITSGPDGALWFTNHDTNTIGRITTAGVVSVLPAAANKPRDIVTGPDGALWYTNDGGPTIGRITTAGATTAYVVAGATFDITNGPDGNLWFTMSTQIGRITPAGVATAFSGPSVSAPSGIVAGSDGALWFPNYNNSSMGRVTTAGVITRTIDPQLFRPNGIASGPDGALWFPEYSSDGRSGPGSSSAIGRITTGLVVSTFYGNGVNEPAGIAVGTDGALWFASQANGRIGRVTTDGAFSTFDAGASLPRAITAGSDGNLWYTDCNAQFGTCMNTIWRMTPTGTTTSFTTQSQVRTLALGPDGALWFPAPSLNMIGRIATDGTTTYFGGAGISNPLSIVAGPDGALWFTNKDSTSIGRITTAGVVTSVTSTSLAGVTNDLRGIAAGSDGNLWVATTNVWYGSFLVRVTPAGVAAMFPIPAAAGAIVAGPDGALWFTAPSIDKIGRMTTDGTVTTYAKAGLWGVSGPTDLVAGPDGNIWFTNTTSSTIGIIGTPVS